MRYLVFVCAFLFATNISFAQGALAGNAGDTAIVAKHNWDNDIYWKWGEFYFNKDDHRMFPPKRSGIGWTVNFANPLSVGSIILVIAVIFIANNSYKKGKKRKAGLQ